MKIPGKRFPKNPRKTITDIIENTTFLQQQLRFNTLTGYELLHIAAMAHQADMLACVHEAIDDLNEAIQEVREALDAITLELMPDTEEPMEETEEPTPAALPTPPEPSYIQKVLEQGRIQQTPLFEADISTRAFNVLIQLFSEYPNWESRGWRSRDDIKVGDLTLLTLPLLRHTINCGPKTVGEIVDLAASAGITIPKE